MLVPSLAILIAAAACLPAALAAPFPLSALLSRQAGDGKPAFTKIPFHRVRHDGRSNEKRQISQGLQANHYYASYAAQISIGSPPQDFWFQLDTGSSMVFVAGEGYSSAGDPYYDPSKSSTAHATENTNVTLGYGGGTATGDQYTDTLSFFGLPQENFRFVTATSSTGLIAFPGTSGLIGLSSSKLTTNGNDAFIQTLVDQQQVESVAFSFSLEGLKTQAEVGWLNGRPPYLAPGGTFTLGTSFDTTQYQGELVTVNQSEYPPTPGAWTVPLTAVRFNNFTFDPAFALIDSGTSGMAVPQEALDQILSSIPGATVQEGITLLPCDYSFTTFEFDLNGVPFSVGPGALLNGPTSDPAFCSTFLSASSQPSLWILGDAFMKYYFVGFTAGPNPSISFGQLPDNGVVQASTTSGNIAQPTVATREAQASPLPQTVSVVSMPAVTGGPFASTNQRGATRSSLAAIATGQGSSSNGNSNGSSNGAMSAMSASWASKLFAAGCGLVALLAVAL
ncbi:acid protease [Jaminaea rosea]|uniref:Acid protease n=1 Tax=Jaminaea rosea TaxID=1569628 RepID=A0A316UZY9_9BASI|nr:acid protease [Jaminaea rosea]PWN30792.1 acid protease [Jaminaea rosea]